MTTTPPDSVPASARDATAEYPESRLEARPGVLRGGATLTLQTRQAQRLVKGRSYSAEKPAIIGLLRFANLLRPIWHGARADDPYADWWMLKVHDALELAWQRIDGAERETSTRFEAMTAMEVAAPTAQKPVRVVLNFSNPYAFRGARLVGRFDELVRCALSARHVGLLTREEAEQTLHVGGRQVRRAFLSPLAYRLTGVCREDIEQGNAKARQASEAMGELPVEVLSGDRRAPYAPSVAVPSSATATEHLRLQPLPTSR